MHAEPRPRRCPVPTVQHDRESEADSSPVGKPDRTTSYYASVYDKWSSRYFRPPRVRALDSGSGTNIDVVDRAMLRTLLRGCLGRGVPDLRGGPSLGVVGRSRRTVHLAEITLQQVFVLLRRQNPSNLRQLSLVITSRCHDAGEEDEQNRDDTQQPDYPSKPIEGTRSTGRHHDLRDGAARRISPALLSDVSLRCMGPLRSGGVGASAPRRLEGKGHQTRTIPRRPPTQDAAGQTVGSGTRRSIEGGYSVGAYFCPATQASIRLAHSCIMWRR